MTTATFQHQLLSTILEEEDEKDRKEFGLFRSGSAPPTILDQEDEAEDFRYDPAYFLYSQRLLNPRLPPPIVNWKSRTTNKEGTSSWEQSNTTNKDTNNSTSPSLVDRIQEDFPSTPSSLYNKKKETNWRS